MPSQKEIGSKFRKKILPLILAPQISSEELKANIQFISEDDEKSRSEHEPGHDLHLEYEDRTIRYLHRIIRFAVRILAILMVMVIVWGIGDVLYVLYQRLTAPPFMLLQIDDLLATFGAFLAVLIAIEIFINIRMYLSTNIIPVRLVIATALMAPKVASRSSI